MSRITQKSSAKTVSLLTANLEIISKNYITCDLEMISEI
jgi:hypothetical protein